MATANFISTDMTTKGTWIGVYGTQGYYVPQIGSAFANSPPSYTTVTTSGTSLYEWNGSDPNTVTKSLQKPANPSGVREAACWYAAGSWDMLFDLGTNTRRISVYMLDYDSFGPRSYSIAVKDAGTAAVLDTKTSTNYTSGIWLTWELTGNIKITFTNTVSGGSNIVASMVAFDPISLPSYAYWGMFSAETTFQPVSGVWPLSVLSPTVSNTSTYPLQYLINPPNSIIYLASVTFSYAGYSGTPTFGLMFTNSYYTYASTDSIVGCYYIQPYQLIHAQNFYGTYSESSTSATLTTSTNYIMELEYDGTTITCYIRNASDRTMVAVSSNTSSINFTPNAIHLIQDGSSGTWTSLITSNLTAIGGRTRYLYMRMHNGVRYLLTSTTGLYGTYTATDSINGYNISLTWFSGTLVWQLDFQSTLGTFHGDYYTSLSNDPVQMVVSGIDTSTDGGTSNTDCTIQPGPFPNYPISTMTVTGSDNLGTYGTLTYQTSGTYTGKWKATYSSAGGPVDLVVEVVNETPYFYSVGPSGLYGTVYHTMATWTNGQATYTGVAPLNGRTITINWS